MEVTLTPDQQAFVRQAIESGRLHDAEDAVREALALWEERERKRAELLACIDEAEASLARGEGRMMDEESTRELAAEIKRRGRARLDAEKPTVR
jgi:putative addiction module CopG family antidote